MLQGQLSLRARLKAIIRDRESTSPKLRFQNGYGTHSWTLELHVEVMALRLRHLVLFVFGTLLVSRSADMTTFLDIALSEPLLAFTPMLAVRCQDRCRSKAQK